MNHKLIIFSFFAFFIASGLFAQAAPTPAQTQAAPTPAQNAQGQTAQAQDAQGTQATGDLPRQFRQLSLGMGLDDLKDNLIKDGYFNFRGDRDVSFLPAREQSLVETTGSSFIKRAFFQLRDGTVFIMAFSLNTEIIDHYSVFTQFVEKYGEPSFLDPRMAVWETEETRIAIERPLTVKYIDKAVFDDIVNESGLIQSGQVRQRQEFLNEF
jgi:hypothetical protein